MIKNYYFGFIYNIYKLTLLLIKETINRNEPIKPKYKQFLDQFCWLLKERRINNLYWAEKLHLKGKSINDYIGQNEINKLKRKAERKYLKYNQNPLNYNILTKDKFITNSFLQSFDIPCVENKYLIKDGICYELPSLKKMFLEDILSQGKCYYFKNTILEFDEGIIKVETAKNNEEISFVKHNRKISEEDFYQFLSWGFWVVQDKMLSHWKIRQLNESALNTLRIVTIKEGIEYRYLTGFLSIATGNSSSDRWADGAIYIGLDLQRRTLMKNGYISTSSGKIKEVHKYPDSGIVFQDFEIPYLDEAIDICCKAHHIISHCLLIGWDLVITDEGPLILEANETPGLMACQLVSGGFRKKIEEAAQNMIDER